MDKENTDVAKTCATGDVEPIPTPLERKEGTLAGRARDARQYVREIADPEREPKRLKVAAAADDDAFPSDAVERTLGFGTNSPPPEAEPEMTDAAAVLPQTPAAVLLQTPAAVKQQAAPAVQQQAAAATPGLVPRAAHAARTRVGQAAPAPEAERAIVRRDHAPTTRAVTVEQWGIPAPSIVAFAEAQKEAQMALAEAQKEAQKALAEAQKEAQKALAEAQKALAEAQKEAQKALAEALVEAVKNSRPRVSE